MEAYYFGGYFLIKPEPFSFGSIKSRTVHTGSSCINVSAFDVSWCLSWTGDLDDKQKTVLALTEEQIANIHKWTDRKFNEGIIRWGNALPDLETVRTFRDLFYTNRDDICLYALYLSKTDADSLIAHFMNEEVFKGDFTLRQCLQKKIEEKVDDTEELIGYDLIGVENSGSFHSFYCHDIAEELVSRFSLSLNERGLFQDIPNPDSIRRYLNDKDAPVEPVPWYIAKMKRPKIRVI